MSNKNIIFSMNGNKELYNELLRTVNRAATATDQIHNRQKRRGDPELKLLLGFNKKLGQNTENSSFNITRPELRLIQALLINVSATLYNSVIPNYKH